MEDERSSGQIPWMKQDSVPRTTTDGTIRTGSTDFDLLLEPYLREFDSRAPAVYQHAIFPSHFHGKCQNTSTGIDPPGCPNPDCPVVCGTPGSMVHFYSDLAEIALNSALSMAKEMAKPQSSSYKRVVQALEERSTRPRRLLRFSRTSVSASGGNLSVKHRESPNEFTTRHMASLPHMVEVACGGGQTSEINAISHCRWETEMKNFILSFP